VKTRNFLIAFALIIILYNCKSGNKADDNTRSDSLFVSSNGNLNSLNTEQQFHKEIKLENNFIIKLGREEDFKEFKTYSLFQLSRNNKIFYVDSSLTEYEIRDTLYPFLLPKAHNKFELLVEINNRPFKNYLKRFYIENNKVTKIDSLPTFIAPPNNFSKDGRIIVAGYWNDSQLRGENYGMTGYSPIIYYYINVNGIFLDSQLTIERNKLIYGNFKGFEFNENIEFPKSVLENFEKEIKMIESLKK
jgi:hypothetical protein